MVTPSKWKKKGLRCYAEICGDPLVNISGCPPLKGHLEGSGKTELRIATA